MSGPSGSAAAHGGTLAVHERTDVGRVRDHNEDSKFADPEGGFFIVADGMGGHAAGEVASLLAVEEVSARLADEREVLATVGRDPNALSRPVMTELLKRIARDANTAVRKRTIEDPKTKGMGTTLEMLCVTADGAWIGHVGDSRTYLIRSGDVTQLTIDQTVAQQLSDSKREQMSEVLEQWGSVLVEAIGAKEDVNADVVHCELVSGDKLLMCSDGLYEYFPRAEEIGEIVAMEGPKAGLERLVDLAFERGGKDNITGLLIDVIEAPVRVEGVFEDTTEDGLAFDMTVDGAAAVVTPTPPQASTLEDEDEADVHQDYGIAEAIALMRVLPKEDIELVVRVLKRTLASAGVATRPIIREGKRKQERIERRVALLRSELEGLEQEIASHRQEIEALESDREETTLVKDRLELAVKLDADDEKSTSQ